MKEKQLTYSANFMMMFQRDSNLPSTMIYLKNSSISGTKSHNFNVSRLDQQLSLPNPLPYVKSRMNMAPAMFQWWTILLPTKVRLMLEVWRQSI